MAPTARLHPPSVIWWRKREVRVVSDVTRNRCHTRPEKPTSTGAVRNGAAQHSRRSPVTQTGDSPDHWWSSANEGRCALSGAKDGADCPGVHAKRTVAGSGCSVRFVRVPQEAAPAFRSTGPEEGFLPVPSRPAGGQGRASPACPVRPVDLTQQPQWRLAKQNGQALIRLRMAAGRAFGQALVGWLNGTRNDSTAANGET